MTLDDLIDELVNLRAAQRATGTAVVTVLHAAFRNSSGEATQRPVQRVSYEHGRVHIHAGATGF